MAVEKERVIVGRKNISWKTRALAAEKREAKTREMYNQLLDDLQSKFKSDEIPPRIEAGEEKKEKLTKDTQTKEKVAKEAQNQAREQNEDSSEASSDTDEEKLKDDESGEGGAGSSTDSEKSDDSHLENNASSSRNDSDEEIKNPEEIYRYHCLNCNSYFNDFKDGECPSCQDKNADVEEFKNAA